MSIRSVACALLLLSLLAAPAAFAGYQAKTPPLDTPWTDKVSRTSPWPQYPRPQLVRDRWENLNGQWQFGPAVEGLPPPIGLPQPETILVPFPIQSALSGIMRNQNDSWYRRTFRVPDKWGQRRVLLHFGAVTHSATVYVNGVNMGSHDGSYDAFSFDITDAIRRGQENEVLVRVSDTMIVGGHPVGKQFPFSYSVLFTASSGIWQTVWLEPVDDTHVERLDQRPDVRGRKLIVTPRVSAPDGASVMLIARDGQRVVGRATGLPGARIAVPVPRPKLWSPAHPFLYRLDVEVTRAGRVVDRARSYFGMRSIRLKRVGGVMRPVLNGKFVFQTGPLDQGFWPDGIYTAPTDEALRFDIELEKRLGFNMVRKHVKVEPDRWYYWADKLGILVWQDMPNMPIYYPVAQNPQVKPQFERELKAMVELHRSHPSIVTWTPFNEGWGQYDVERIVALVKRLDPSRLVNGHSGAANCCLAVEPKNGDFRDNHMYTGPTAPAPDAHRASVIGEYGGFGGRTPGHEWQGTSTSAAYQPVTDNPPERARNGLLRQMFGALGQEMRKPGLSAAVFTEITDVEREFGGLITYDRRVPKVDFRMVRRLNLGLIRQSRTRGALRAQRPATPRGATAHWTFDEGSGAVARDRGGNRAHELALRGATWTRGVRGHALGFDGGGAKAVAPGPVVDTRRSFTVSAWLRHDDGTQNSSAVAQEGQDAPGFSLGHQAKDTRDDLQPGYAVYGYTPDPAHPPHRWTFDVPGTGANTAYGDGPLTPPAGKWQYVTGVVNRANLSIGLYVNGVPLDSRHAEQTWNAAGPFLVGAASAGQGRDTFHGAVDELRVYSRALRPGAIWQLYRAERRKVRRSR